MQILARHSLWTAAAILVWLASLSLGQQSNPEPSNTSETTAPTPADPTPAEAPSLETTPVSENHFAGELGGTALRINEDAITSAEVLASMTETFKEMEKGLDPKVFLAKAQPLVLRATTAKMYDLLIYQHAKSVLSKNENYEDILNKAMETERKTLLARYNGEISRAREELAQKGSTIEKELEAVKRELIVSSFREAYFTPTLEITRGEKQQYYWRNQQKEFEQPAELEFRLIEIPFQAFASVGMTKTQAAEKAKAQADAAMAKLSEGMDFAEAAKEYSRFRPAEGGYWKGNPDSLQERYSPVVKALETIAPGAHTNLVENDDRFFIAQLIRRQDPRTIPFSEAQELITEQIRKERWQKFFSDLSGKLLDKAVVGDVDSFVRDTAAVAYKVYLMENPGK